MPRVLSITRASSHDRRQALILEADKREESIVASVLASGFTFDWDAILSDSNAILFAKNPIEEIARRVDQQLASEDFSETTAALEINGKLLAAWTQKRNEENAGMRAPEPALTFADRFPLKPGGSIQYQMAPNGTIRFAEPAVFTPVKAVAYWQRILGLTDEQALRILERVAKIYARAPDISRAVMEKVTELYSRTISEGVGLPEFIREARQALPDASKAILETEYRTHLADTYVGTAYEIVLERASTFPFLQLMSIPDTRRSFICFVMGTFVRGKGYIAATDDPIWLKWRPPLHYRCRTAISPISYLEAQRLGILAKDGRTKIALVGDNPNRPYGDPPAFAEDPNTGKMRAVQPQEGFGG